MVTCACFALAGCSTPSQPIAELPPGPAGDPLVPAGPASTTRTTDLDRLLDQQAAAVSAMERGTESPQQTTPVAHRGPAGPRAVLPPASNTGPVVEVRDSGADQDMAARPQAAAAGTPDPVSLPAVEPVVSPRERIALLAAQTAALLAAESESSPTPVAELARLGVLELVAPGIFDEYAGALDESSPLQSLTRRDVEFLRAWVELVRVAGERLDTSGDAMALLDLVEGLHGTLELWEPLAIPSATLCTRVEGYGVFRELPRFASEGERTERYKFIAGRPHKMIVYAELDNLSYRPTARDGIDGYSVELEQELRLFHHGDHTADLQWRKPAERIEDFSRNHRRDFFVVQIIELPANLTVGRYDLKLSVTDRGSGSLAEAFIPIDIVADVSAFAQVE